MRNNLTNLMNDYGKMAERLADVLNGKEYSCIILDKVNDFDND